MKFTQFISISVVLLGSVLMRKVFNEPAGVAVGTQPLSLIMEDKISNSIIPIAVVTMGGKIKKELSEENTGEADMSSSENDILLGLTPVLIGHPESWANSVGQNLLKKLHLRGQVLMNFVDEMHQGLADHWNSIRSVWNPGFYQWCL